MTESRLTYTPARSTPPLMLTAAAIAGLALCSSAALAAGDVTVSVTRRTVVVRGDAVDNQIQIAYDSVTGDLTVAGEDGTTVGGGGETVIAMGARDLVVNLEAGSNSATLSGGAPRSVRLLGGVDSDFFTVRGGSVARNLTVDGGGGSNSLTVDDVGVGRRLRVLGGDEEDTIDITDSALSGPVTLDGRDGGDFIYMFNTTTERPTQIRGGAGNDNVLTSITNVHESSIKFHLGEGDDRLDFGKAKVQSATPYGGRLTVLGAGGDDSFFAFGPIDLTRGGLVSMGGGNDDVQLSRWNSTRPLKLLGGNDNDTLTMFSAHIHGPVSLIGGRGDDSLRADGVGAEGMTLSGGPGLDTIDGESLDVSRSTRLLGGPDDDRMFITRSELSGSIFVIAGSGDDEATLSGLSVTGSGLLNGGRGEDTLLEGDTTFAREPRRPGWEELGTPEN